MDTDLYNIMNEAHSATTDHYSVPEVDDQGSTTNEPQGTSDDHYSSSTNYSPDPHDNNWYNEEHANPVEEYSDETGVTSDDHYSSSANYSPDIFEINWFNEEHASPVEEYSDETGATSDDDNDNTTDGGTKPGTREQMIEITNHFEHGTIGHTFNQTVRGFRFVVGETNSNAPLLEWLRKPETQDLMGKPMTDNEAKYQFAQEEQETWGKDTIGDWGAKVGATISPAVRVPIMDGISLVTGPNTEEQEELLHQNAYRSLD
jgi:hypothetical protein